jgi:hypothetical protein
MQLMAGHQSVGIALLANLLIEPKMAELILR